MASLKPSFVNGLASSEEPADPTSVPQSDTDDHAQLSHHTVVCEMLHNFVVGFGLLILLTLAASSRNQATSYVSQHYSVPVPSQGDDVGGGTSSQDGVASRRVVGVSASVIFSCTIKSRRWQAMMEEVDKGCSEFCITAGTVTRTVGILIHSWLKALAVNLSQPSS